MLSINFLSDAFGRKKAIYTLWFILVTSIIAESLASHWWSWLIAKASSPHPIYRLLVSDSITPFKDIGWRWRWNAAGDDPGVH